MIGLGLCLLCVSSAINKHILLLEMADFVAMKLCSAYYLSGVSFYMEGHIKGALLILWLKHVDNDLPV